MPAPGREPSDWPRLDDAQRCAVLSAARRTGELSEPLRDLAERARSSPDERLRREAERALAGG